MRPEACAVAEEALNRIETHEAVCAFQSRQTREAMDRIESGMNSAHSVLQQSITDINKSILRVLVWLTLLFGGAAASLIVYIFINTPKGFAQ